MAKGKKKKKDLDFQKVKLKLGRKLKRDDNETKAEFHTRKIVLKEVKSYSDDPLTALARHSEHISHHGKLSMLNHFNSALTQEIVKSLNKPILDSLSKFIVDHSDQVRAATYKCLKTCFNHIKQQHLSTRDFVESLKPYLDCAYTHISHAIETDCQKFIEHLVNINDPQVFEPLMDIVLRGYEVGNVSLSERNLAIKLRDFYLRNRQKQNVENLLKSDRLEPLVWTHENFLLDLDWQAHDLSCKLWVPEREFRLDREAKQENIIQRYLSVIGNQIGEEPITNGTNSNTRSTKKRRVL